MVGMRIDSSTPSQQNVQAAGISAFIDALEAGQGIEPHGLIIQRHGHRVAEGYWAPHNARRSRLVYSLSKSFTGTALALQLGEGRLSLDDLVSDHLPAYFTDADDRTRRLRIRHIASMATGHDREMLLESYLADAQDPLRGFFTLPPDAEPGTLFAYSQPPVLALATILQNLAGERLVDYLRPRVLDPLGIQDFRWSQHVPGTDLGFSGVHTNLDAIARLGQLYLDNGVADGVRLLPEGWVAAAGSVQVANPQRVEPDWARGYGFQLWMSRHGYRGDGAFGQYMVVLPELDAVVALFSCTAVMQTVMDLIWEHLVPAMEGAGNATHTPSPDDEALAERLINLALPTVQNRLGGSFAHLDPAGGNFASATFTPNSHRPATHIAVDPTGKLITVHEGESSTPLTLSLSTEWTIGADAAFASCATTSVDGRVCVDVAVLETPHRLEIVLDPTAGTFTAEWPVVPLFLGTAPLSSMRAPE